MFRKSVSYDDMVTPSQVASVGRILTRARSSGLPHGAVTFWLRRKAPRRQVYSGPISETIVQSLREVVGPRVAVSIVRNPSKNYSVWQTVVGD